jgi:hypothetical protein
MSLMKSHRLRAPAEDGGLLAVPPLGAAGALVASNGGRLDDWDHDFQGRRAARLRHLARRQVLEASRAHLARFDLDLPERLDPSVPWIVTGHQPELFHPGVWVKNFATAAMARAQGGVGLNLVVDNDLPKSTTIRVPQRLDGTLRVPRVDFDAWSGDAPYEDLEVRDEELFASFPRRVREVLDPAIADPLVDDFWPRVLRRVGPTRNLGLRFAAARRDLEASWGAHNHEVPLSALCETEAFLWFASHLLAQLPRFQRTHNDALARYRQRYRIRSRHHPVPALAEQGEWREAPFWIWTAAEPRRRPLFVRQLPRHMELRAGGDDRPWLELPLGPDREACCAVERLHSLPAQGIRLRTRALTTTMFARLLLGDLFVHGIGGAKYDELGDEVIRGFFGVEPPDYLTLSMTLWLGLPGSLASRAGVEAAARALRDLAYNPDRHLGTPPPREALPWVEARRQALLAPVETHPERLARFQEIRRCNEALQRWVVPSRDALRQELGALEQGVRQNQTARSREYAFVLHSEGRLRETMSGLMAETSRG